MLTPTEKIWHNGRFIRWEEATIHVLSHVVSYGSSVFEGIRCYSTPSGPAVFRLREHVRRMLNSAKIYRMENLGFTADQLAEAMLELVRVNHMDACYIRPIVLRGYGEVGVNPLKNPIDVYIACWEWGQYLGEEALAEGVDVCVSSWTRLAPNTLPALAKAGANYMNSQLIKMEALANGYSEGIALDAAGYVSEGSGENIFVVRDGKIHTPLYIADEVFFSGTAAEITPIRSIDRIPVGKGRRGPVAEKLQKEFFGIINGSTPDRYGWLSPVHAHVAA